MDLTLTNSQTPIVVSTNTTALNDRNYTVVANATFTDPSPVEGKGFKVFVRNGTAVIGGTSYGANSLVFRVFHSGAWANTLINVDLTNYYTKTETDTLLDAKIDENAAITGATKTKITYDSKGLVTSGTDATTADIADSTDKRYVTDADLSAISGMVNIHDHNPSSTATGTSEFILKSIQVGNSIFTSSDFLNVMCDFVRPIKTGTCQLRMYISPNDNSLTGATQIAISTLNNSTVGYVTEFKREFQIKSGNLSGMKFDVAGNTPVVTISQSSLAFDNTASRYLIITSTFSVGSDTGTVNKVQIKNF